MLKIKTKSSKLISKKKTAEKYPRELIEQVYKMTYAMLKYKYKNQEITEDEVVEMAVEESAEFLTNRKLLPRNPEQIPYANSNYLLYKFLKTQLNIII